MKVIVENEDEAIYIARYLGLICNTIKNSNIHSVQASSIEIFLCGIRDSIKLQEVSKNEGRN